VRRAAIDLSEFLEKQWNLVIEGSSFFCQVPSEINESEMCRAHLSDASVCEGARPKDTGPIRGRRDTNETDFRLSVPRRI